MMLFEIYYYYLIISVLTGSFYGLYWMLHNNADPYNKIYPSIPKSLIYGCFGGFVLCHVLPFYLIYDIIKILL